jgi:transcriptional regulator with XRE-family HTH domain
MKISERLSQLRVKLDISQPAAATRFHIPLPSWKNYEKGPSEPGSGALRGLAEGGVNINWLLTGEGEMLLTDQTGNADKSEPSQIDTKEFVHILERLAKKDFEGRGLGTSFIGYFAAIIYNRIISQGEDFRELHLEASIHELNLILLDSAVDNMEKSITAAKEGDFKMPSDAIDGLQQIADNYTDRLRNARGMFATRMLAPGTELESEFIKGLGL